MCKDVLGGQLSRKNVRYLNRFKDFDLLSCIMRNRPFRASQPAHFGIISHFNTYSRAANGKNHKSAKFGVLIPATIYLFIYIYDIFNISYIFVTLNFP